MPMKDITVYHTNSAVTPLSGTSTATRQLYMSGNATLQAATAIRKNLLDRASKHFEETPEEPGPGRREGLCQSRSRANACSY